MQGPVGDVPKSEEWRGSQHGFPVRGFLVAASTWRRMVHRLQGQDRRTGRACGVPMMIVALTGPPSLPSQPLAGLPGFPGFVSTHRHWRLRGRPGTSDSASIERASPPRRSGLARWLTLWLCAGGRVCCRVCRVGPEELFASGIVGLSCFLGSLGIVGAGGVAACGTKLLARLFRNPCRAAFTCREGLRVGDGSDISGSRVLLLNGRAELDVRWLWFDVSGRS